MSTTARAVEGLDVSSWLAELHMECYKKNLENYDTVKGLLDLREADIKKLGVVNSKDRSRMMNSLASFRGGHSSGITVVPATQVSLIQESNKSLLRKGSLRKLNIKSLLGNSNSKKSKNSKKVVDSTQITEPPLVSTVSEIVDDLPIPTVGLIPTSGLATSNSSLSYSLPAPPQIADKSTSSAIADYEELPDETHPLMRSTTIDSSKPFHVAQRHPAVENEYVPSPENSPQFSAQRPRANTIASPTGVGEGQVFDHNHWFIHHSGIAPHMQHSVNSTPELQLRARPNSGVHHTPSDTSSDSPGQAVHKHLSVVSMESGLSFGYDVEKDFNPALPLDSQPWFHGKILRGDAEMLLHDDGDFLVRENTTLANTYTLTLRWRGVPDHTLIGTTEVVSTTAGLKVGTTIKYQFDSGAFDSIPELIFNHLKYQIPVDKAQHTLITNPVCRSGAGGKSSLYASFGGYSPGQRSNASPESSPGYKGRSASPQEQARSSQMLRLSKTMSVNPYMSTRDSPPRQTDMMGIMPSHTRMSRHMSSGDLLESSKEDIPVALRNVISPPPNSASRSMTISHASYARAKRESFRRSGSNEPSYSHTLPHGLERGEKVYGADDDNHKRMDSFGDYEVMESVSLFGDSPTGTRRPSPIPQPQVQNVRSLQRPYSADVVRKPQMAMKDSSSLDKPLRQRERVKYAEIRYTKNTVDEGRAVLIKPGGSSVNYAEVRFARSNTMDCGPSPLYDIVPPGRREASPQAIAELTAKGAYQSRAEILAQKARQGGEPNYALPNTLASRQANLSSASSHSVNYSTVILPGQTPSPSTGIHPPQSTSSLSASPASTSSSALTSEKSHLSVHQEPPIYAMPKKLRPGSGTASQDLSSSNDSLLSATSSNTSASPASKKRILGSSLVHSHTPSTKVHRNLPGYEELVRAHTILQNHSNEELAYHMTRTDAVSFMLAPRPGEDKSIWKERTAHITGSSGMLCGLQTLADPNAGEALWKKLYYRHLSLSQTVTLTIITAGDAMERVKLLRRYISVAQLLQSPDIGNLFSFMAVMLGLSAPQLSNMADLWPFLGAHYSEDMEAYKSLQGTMSALEEGNPVLSPNDLVIPAIQPLRDLFHFTEPFSTSHCSPVRQDLVMVQDFTNHASKMDSLRYIVSRTSQMALNAWKKLQSLQYNFSLVEFFSQDFTRVYLQSMNVLSDDPMERRRRCGLLMDALIDRVESSETV